MEKSVYWALRGFTRGTAHGRFDWLLAANLLNLGHVDTSFGTSRFSRGACHSPCCGSNFGALEPVGGHSTDERQVALQPNRFQARLEAGAAGTAADYGQAYTPGCPAAKIRTLQRWYLAGANALNVGKEEEARKPFARSALGREAGLRLLVATTRRSSRTTREDAGPGPATPASLRLAALRRTASAAPTIRYPCSYSHGVNFCQN